MKDDSIAVMLGCLCATILVSIALLKGVDGVMFSGGLTLIGVLVGYLFGVKTATGKTG